MARRVDTSVIVLMRGTALFDIVQERRGPHYFLLLAWQLLIRIHFRQRIEDHLGVDPDIAFRMVKGILRNLMHLFHPVKTLA
jgi:hypothetical protein